MNLKATAAAAAIVIVGIGALVLFLSAGKGHTVFVPDDAARHRERGEFLLNKRRHTTNRQQKAELLAKAIGEFKKALEIKPDFAVAHNMLGHCYMEMGNWEAARRHLDQALEIRPDYPAAHYNRGQLYQRLSVTRRDQVLLDKALVDYQKALASELAAAFAGDILQAMSDVYRLKGNIEKAIEMLERYLKRSPHAADVALVQRKIRGLELMKQSSASNRAESLPGGRRHE